MKGTWKLKAIITTQGNIGGAAAVQTNWMWLNDLTWGEWIVKCAITAPQHEERVYTIISETHFSRAEKIRA